MVVYTMEPPYLPRGCRRRAFGGCKRCSGWRRKDQGLISSGMFDDTITVTDAEAAGRVIQLAGQVVSRFCRRPSAGHI